MDERNETVLVNTEVEQTGGTDEEELGRLYQELGKAYYEGAYEDPLPQLLPLFDEITKIVSRQENQQSAMAEDFGDLQNPRDPGEKRYCANCGAELPGSARFCGICGTPVNEGR